MPFVPASWKRLTLRLITTTQQLNDACFALVVFHYVCVCQEFDRRRGTNPFIQIPIAKMVGKYMMGRVSKY
jgi:hypothetical protein